MSDIFEPVLQKLDGLHSAGKSVGFWLRDDDAIESSSALDRLIELAGHHGCEVLLAVIPMIAKQSLSDRLKSEKHIFPCQHGYAHQNHAPVGTKKTELLVHSTRSVASVVLELVEGRQRLETLFSDKFFPTLVPPWNRISEAVALELGKIGYNGISGFGWASIHSSIPQFHTHIDIMNWKDGRRGQTLLETAHLTLQTIDEASIHTADSVDPAIGILTHHLVHDDNAWKSLEKLVAIIGEHPACKFIPIKELHHNAFCRLLLSGSGNSSS